MPAELAALRPEALKGRMQPTRPHEPIGTTEPKETLASRAAGAMGLRRSTGPWAEIVVEHVELRFPMQIQLEVFQDETHEHLAISLVAVDDVTAETPRSMRQTVFYTLPAFPESRWSQRHVVERAVISSLTHEVQESLFIDGVNGDPHALDEARGAWFVQVAEGKVVDHDRGAIDAEHLAAWERELAVREADLVDATALLERLLAGDEKAFAEAAASPTY